ncbi:MAG: alpha/beta hydrolase [Arachnia sp.]
MSRWVKVTQVILAIVAAVLVASLFAGGMVGGASRDQPATPKPSGEPSALPLPEGARLPGVPEKPVKDHALLPAVENANADRQLDYKPKGDPQVTFLDSLGDLRAYATQVVAWKKCEDSDTSQCAKVRVPLDWDDPAGEAIEIAVRRVPGGDSSRGPLFVNPGGPGFGGQDIAEGLAGRWANYDTIGWDPRGTGESTHVVCGTMEQTDKIMDLDASPDDDAEIAALRQGAVDFARQCRDASGALLDHITTIDVVRDLDLLRHLLGAEKLNYVGISYGTFVGAMYAELFPNSVGRLVLDSAVEITDEEPIPQSAGFELALTNFADWCADSSLCSLGTSSEQVLDDIDDFLQGLDAKPLKVGARELTQTHAASGIALFLYEDSTAYRGLAAMLGQAYSGDGASLLRAADYMNGREDNHYETIAYAFPAMACVDEADEGVATVMADWRDTFSKAPVMGPNMGTSYTCQEWTAGSAPRLKLTGAGAPPILVVGTTGDSATPYQQAVSMAEQLESGTLLTLEGAGHGAVAGDNQCIAKAVDGYLLDGKAPKDGLKCN